MSGKDVKNTIIVFACIIGFVIAVNAVKDDDSNNPANTAAIEEDVDYFNNSEDENENDAASVNKSINYKTITIKKLAKALEDNPLKAKNKYMDKYLKVTGVVANIDASGDYFSLDESKDSYNIVYPMHCSITDDSQLDKISKMKIGQKVTVKVKITNVGEVIKYTADVIDIIVKE